MILENVVRRENKEEMNLIRKISLKVKMNHFLLNLSMNKANLNHLEKVKNHHQKRIR